MVNRHPDLDWPRVLEDARRLRIRRMLDLGLCLAGDLLGAAVPAALARHVMADRAVQALAAGILRRLDGPLRLPGKLEEMTFWVAARERLRDRGRYLLRTVTTPTTHEVAAVTLPPSLAFLYYPLRPIRLATKYARTLLGR
jgi:hypothetical protein